MDIFSELPENLKKAWDEMYSRKECECQQPVTDLTKELQDLVEIYQDSVDHLNQKHHNHLELMVSHMRHFVEIHDEKALMQKKLDGLLEKIEK